METKTKYKRLRELLAENGMNQNDFAKKLNIKKTAMSMKLSGQRRINQDEINKIINIFGKPYEEIFLDDKVHETKNEESVEDGS